LLLSERDLGGDFLDQALALAFNEQAVITYPSYLLVPKGRSLATGRVFRKIEEVEHAIVGDKEGLAPHRIGEPVDGVAGSVRDEACRELRDEGWSILQALEAVCIEFDLKGSDKDLDTLGEYLDVIEKQANVATYASEELRSSAVVFNGIVDASWMLDQACYAFSCEILGFRDQSGKPTLLLVPKRKQAPKEGKEDAVPMLSDPAAVPKTNDVWSTSAAQTEAKTTHHPTTTNPPLGF
jgi:hypothetical protein